MSKDKDQLLNSNYDGIQEYDNDLPKWWVILFYLTIVYSVIYAGYYYFGFRPTTEKILASQIEDIQNLKKEVAKNEPVQPKLDLVALSKDQAVVQKGKEVYTGKCFMCHGVNGEGTVGPNLTDNYWIHGGKLEQIKHTIEVGVLDKGMMSWKGVLTDEEINSVTAYIRSISGTNPANAKAPQGEQYSNVE